MRTYKIIFEYNKQSFRQLFDFVNDFDSRRQTNRLHRYRINKSILVVKMIQPKFAYAIEWHPKRTLTIV